MSNRSYYLAARLENAEGCARVHELMRQEKWECTYDWSKHGSVKNQGKLACMNVAVAELAGVSTASVTIVLLKGGRGTHCELGGALILGKPVVVHGPDELFGYDDRTSAFYHHPLVFRVATLEEIPVEAERARLLHHFSRAERTFV